MRFMFVAFASLSLVSSVKTMMRSRSSGEFSESEDMDTVVADMESKIEKRLAERFEAQFEARVTKMEEAVANLVKTNALVGTQESASHEDGSRVPTRFQADGSYTDLTLFERLRYLEHKIDGGINWLQNPQLYETTEYNCKNMTSLNTDHLVCFDRWPSADDPHGKPCVVYDLGIHEHPEFGQHMMSQVGCKVRAYDPSPVATKWWASDKNPELKNAGDMYKFHPVGAGGSDGLLALYTYNWQQVSIYRAENDHTIRPPGSPDTPPEKIQLPVKTLKTMMHDNNDTYIDVLKIDIEGSEFMFLQDMFDRMNCPPVGQIMIEWHNFDLDPRYGSSPQINTLHNMLSACGYKAFHTRDHWRTDPQWKQGVRVLPATRYSLASYCKNCWQ